MEIKAVEPQGACCLKFDWKQGIDVLYILFLVWGSRKGWRVMIRCSVSSCVATSQETAFSARRKSVSLGRNVCTDQTNFTSITNYQQSYLPSTAFFDEKQGNAVWVLSILWWSSDGLLLVLPLYRMFNFLNGVLCLILSLEKLNSDPFV